MVDTIFSSKTKEVVIGAGRPFCDHWRADQPNRAQVLAPEMAAGN